MSKSDPLGCLFLDDSPEAIKMKISKSKTDSIPNITYDRDLRQNLAGLIEIMASLKELSPESIAQNFKHFNHSQFKNELCETLITYFKNIREQYDTFKTFPVDDVITEGSIAAAKIASRNFAKFLEYLNK